MPICFQIISLIFLTFSSCSSLKTYAGSTEVDSDFSNYKIPNSVTDISGTFAFCASLTAAPVIPNKVSDMSYTFDSCTSLTGTITINTNPSSYNCCFEDAVRPITLTGSSTKLTVLAATAKFGNATVK